MRHIFAATFAISLLAVPWLMYHPEQASYVYSVIGAAKEQLAAVILTHSPKTVVEIKSRYSEKKSLFGGETDKKVRILLVPGHEPDFGGAEYSTLLERNMNVELADNLQQFLGTNNKYQVFVTRNTSVWMQTFSEYFKNNWDDIIAWKNGHKDQMTRLSRISELHPFVPEVIHNTAPANVALRLFGIGKWSNENDIDIVIHIHFNDSRGHSRNSPGDYSGFAIYVPQNQFFNSSTTQTVANTIFNRLHRFNAVSDLPGESGGIVQDQDLIAIGAYNSLDAASMLIEYGYIYESQFTNPDLYDTAIKDLAFQTYLGLQDFFDDHNPINIAENFDTLVMPYTWNSSIVGKDFNIKDVYSLQTALVLDGVYPPSDKTLNDCPRTGIFGNCTKAAVDTFQRKRGIRTEKGIVGPRTVEELNKLYSVKAI